MKSQKGQSLVEVALILPVLIVIMSGLLDLGRLYFAYVAVTDAAGEGAAYAAIHPDDLDGIVERAQDASRGQVVIDEDLVEFDCPTCPGVQSGHSVTVTVTYSFTLVTPFVADMVGDGVLPLRATATAAVLSGEM